MKNLFSGRLVLAVLAGVVAGGVMLTSHPVQAAPDCCKGVDCAAADAKDVDKKNEPKKDKKIVNEGQEKAD